jgi:hypothetical protein
MLAFTPPVEPSTLPFQYFRPDGKAIAEAQLETLRAVSPALGVVWLGFGNSLLRCGTQIPPHALAAAGLIAHTE